MREHAIFEPKKNLGFVLAARDVCRGCCLSYLSSSLEHLYGKNISEFKGFFRHLFQIRHFRQYIFYHYLMGFQAFYPTIPLICTFRHISLIVLRFLKGKSVILTTMALVLVTMAIVMRTMAVVLGTMAVVLHILGIGILRFE